MENDTDVDEPLIQNCPDCGAAMDVSEVEPLSAVVCPACGAPTTVSSTIDHFELVDMLGHGGMGAVYKAHDTSLDRMVALKLLRKSSGSAEQIKQLETEAAITASINHPHVVRVFSTGIDRGRFYIAMELVEKGTLDRLIELQGRVAEAQVLEVGIQIASGLRAAQEAGLEAGLIHRDVKPGNILFTDAHTAKIVDFGLAIFAEDEAKVRGEIWGTPYYVAPEKLDQKPEDFRSDIYSLGATLFHALAGRPPFEAENASLVALKHLKSQAVSLQAFAPHVSSNTAYVINRTLNKDPDQRYQSYDELIEHLEYALNELQAGRGKAGETRVVLESEQQKKAMGLLSFVMMVLVLLVGAGISSAIIFSPVHRRRKRRTAARWWLMAWAIWPEKSRTTRWRRWPPCRAEAEAAVAELGGYADRPGPVRRGASRGGHRGFSAGRRPRTLFDERCGPGAGESFRRDFAADDERARHRSEGDEARRGRLWSGGLFVLRHEGLGSRGRGRSRGVFPSLPAGGICRPRFVARWTQAVGHRLRGGIYRVSDGDRRWKAAKTIDQKRTALKALKAVQGKLAPKAHEFAVTAAKDVAKARRTARRCWPKARCRMAATS
ncbi:MAG: protein kinase [Chthoniobacter sp.]